MPSILDKSQSLLRESSGSSTTLAGNRTSTVPGGWPVTDKFQIGDTIFLVSVVPKALDTRPISLQTESQSAVIATVAVSPDDQTPKIPGVATRDHFALITFGTANGSHQIELDVTQGNACSLPCSTLEVQVYDETPRPTLNGATERPYPALANAVSVSHFGRSGFGVRTIRAWQPVFFDAPLGDAAIAAAVSSFVPGPVVRPIPPFAVRACLVTASLETANQSALYFLGRNLEVVGLTLFSHGSGTCIFGRDSVVVPLQAEFFAVASSLASPLAPLQGSDLFFARFGLAF